MNIFMINISMRLNELNEDAVGKEINLDESHAWDLKGYWITNDNRILDVDHDNGIHHGDIAMDEFDFGIEDPDDDPSDDDYVREQAIEAAFFDGWIRISSSNNEDTYNVDYTNADKDALKILYTEIRNDEIGFSKYRTPDDKEFDYQEMLRWVRLQMKITEGFEQDPYTAEYKFDFDPKTVTKDEFNEMVRALNDKIGTADPILVNGKEMESATAAGKEMMCLIQPRIDAKKKADAEQEAKWAPHRWDQGPYAKQAEMVPVRWLRRLIGNELRLHGKTAQVLGFNPDTNEYEYGDMDEFVTSIKERGIQEPIMIVVGMRDGYAYIGEGNHRIEAAGRLGMKELPTRVVVQNEANMDFGPRNYTHNVRDDLTWNPDELDSFPEEKYYTKPSQVFKSLSKNNMNEYTDGTSVEQLEKNLENDYKGLQIDLSEHHGIVEIHRIISDRKNRGVGTLVMNEIIDWADKDSKILSLTPSSDFGGSKSRLVKFYKRFGFVNNKGRNKTFKTKNTMVRYPTENINEAMEYTANEKLWIKPEGSDAKIIDITGKTEHHTEHAYKYPQKYGLSGNVFKDYDYETLHDGSKSSYDDHVAEVMFDAGWVRYHQRYEDEAAIHGATFETVAKALQWLRKNARQFDTVVAQSFDDDVTLFNQRDIKSFARTGKKPQSKTSQFRENEELDEAKVQPIDPHKLVKWAETNFKKDYNISDEEIKKHTGNSQMETGPSFKTVDGKIVKVPPSYGKYITEISHDFAMWYKEHEADLKKRGWYISNIEPTRTEMRRGEDWKLNVVRLEPNYTSPAPDNQIEELYHVAPVNVRGKIERKGIIPKKSTRGFGYPARIFLANSTESANKIKDQLIKNDAKHDRERDYDIWAISKDLLRKGTKFFADPEFQFKGVWTYSHIPNNAIDLFAPAMAESINESFDQPYDYKWETQADESWIGKFTTTDGSSVMLELEGYKTSWRIAFDRDGAFGTTGKGDEFKIFGTILSMLSEFVSEMKPEKLFFIAEKNPDPNKKNDSRIKLYRQLIRRFATKHGFNFDEENQGFKTTFRLDKELNEFRLPFTKTKKEKEMIKKHGGLWKHSIKSLQRLLDDPSKIINKHLRHRYTSALYDKRRMLATESLNEYEGMPMALGSKGAWISPEGTEHVIGTSSHEDYIKRFYPKEYPDVAFSKALEDGWTRVTFPLSTRDGFGFNALKKRHIQRALKKYLSDIRMGQYRVDVEWGFNAYDLNSRGVYKILDYDKSRQFIGEGKKKDTLELPDLHVGDELMVGKFKNRKATIKGFKKDKNNQPVAKTNKGDQQIFKGRIKKLMPDKEELKEYKVHEVSGDLPPFSVNVIENPNAQQFMQMLKSSQMNEIRGLIDENGLYIWPSFTFIHGQIAKELGVVDKKHLTLEQDQESGKLTVSLKDETGWRLDVDILQSYAPWQRATKYLNTDNMVVESLKEDVGVGSAGIKIDKYPKSFWYRPKDNTIIPTELEHTDAILIHGEDFDIPENDPEYVMLKQRHGWDDDNYGDSDLWDEDVIKLANKYGWVRAGRHKIKYGGEAEAKVAVFLQTTNKKDLLKAVRDVYKSGMVTYIFVDTDVEDFDMRVYEKPLFGSELRHFVKYGKRESESKLTQFREEKNKEKEDKDIFGISWVK